MIVACLAERLYRSRSAITKNVGLLEKVGLLVSQRQTNPGHGIQKIACSNRVGGNAGVSPSRTHL